MAPMSQAFVAEIEKFAKTENIEIVRFKKGERKDDITQQRLQQFNQAEGVLYIGKAQEKFSTFHVQKRFSEEHGVSFPWLMRSTVLCNQYYFYIVDEEFTPGKMTYDLRRLRLHELIERIPHTHRYEVTQEGIKVCLFFTKVPARIFRTGLAQIGDGLPEGSNRQVTAAMNNLDKAIDKHVYAAKIAG